MNNAGKKIQAYSALPSVETLLQAVNHINNLPHALKKDEIQSILAAFRKKISKQQAFAAGDIEVALIKNLDQVNRSLRKVINGTGVVIHTNLGRSPYSKAMLEQLRLLQDGYVNLELDLSTGKRGSRHDHLRPWIKATTRAEDGILVNNNAAAVLLALNSLANRKEVVISRGQLVEIGGSFRIPEILKKAGSKLVEVGTTNRTHPSDYEAAISERTALLLWVHSSNYKISGFTKEVPLKDLVELGRQHNIPVMADLGSGALVSIDKYDLQREPLVAEVIDTGVDIVTFSVDKLLGGPQGGIIAGKHDLLKKIEKNHLLRALRPDKSQIILVKEGLKMFSDLQELENGSPIYRDFATDPAVLSSRVKDLIGQVSNEQLSLNLIKTTAEVGSGASPSETMRSVGLEISHQKKSATAISRLLRTGDPAILGRIQNDRFILDFKAVRKEEDPYIIEALRSL
ncbi:MAG: L-seryl-tRNA(Sec) selenium transferase [Candidatus Marinimicrobia bacterium]|nr:L-seryl-tRNA(Sec) selenium transferase [Candidatus Neomarinimicrobiota bacterium]MCF7851185.1 L-seryl-tRNA(Sec) selenium transferase [Candidatus Neomarinimicrobiota bacterium]MCF7904232.1 L-seryl-tRNA(Sec) selenium transferase [Candidatus Neomarinimicrobiota bacterium]